LVHGLCRRSRSGDTDQGVERNRYRREAQFRAARLIAQLEGNVLFAERSTRERVHGKAKNYRSLVHVERLLGNCERFELSFGINHFDAAEAGRE